MKTTGSPSLRLTLMVTLKGVVCWTLASASKSNRGAGPAVAVPASFRTVKVKLEARMKRSAVTSTTNLSFSLGSSMSTPAMKSAWP